MNWAGKLVVATGQFVKLALKAHKTGQSIDDVKSADWWRSWEM